MKRYFEEHPTIRGFAIIAVIALVVVLLSLQATLVSLFLLARIAFFLAAAFFIYLVWRDRRADIAVWPRRAYVAFYGAALVAVVAFGYYVLKMDAIVAFWLAYILTRPVGASFGDLFSQPRQYGGLGFGSVVTSYIFLAGIVAVVVYMTFSHDGEEDPGRRDGD